MQPHWAKGSARQDKKVPKTMVQGTTDNAAFHTTLILNILQKHTHRITWRSDGYINFITAIILQHIHISKRHTVHHKFMQFLLVYQLTDQRKRNINNFHGVYVFVLSVQPSQNQSCQNPLSSMLLLWSWSGQLSSAGYPCNASLWQPVGGATLFVRLSPACFRSTVLLQITHTSKEGKGERCNKMAVCPSSPTL